MLPRSKPLLVFLVAVPLLIFAWMWQLAQKRPRLVGVLRSSASALALSRDGKLLAVRTGSGSVAILPTDQSRFLPLQTERKIPTGPFIGISSPTELQFSPDAQTLFGSDARLYGIDTTQIYAWDTQTRKIKWSAVTQYTDDISRFWPSPDGKLVVGRSYDVVKVLNVSGEGSLQNSKHSKFARSFPVVTRFQARIREANGGDSLPQALALSPDGKTLALSTLTGRLQFWSVQTSQRQSQTTATAALSNYSSKGELQFSPDGRFVAFFDGTTISVWNIAARKWTGATVSNITSESQISLAWMPDSRSLWTGSGSTQQWSVPQLKSLRELPIGGPMAVSGDGRTLATRNAPGNGIPNGVWLWNIA